VLILIPISSGNSKGLFLFFILLFIHFDIISDPDDEGKISNQKRRAKNSAMASMKTELKHLLSQPLIARGISTRYITSGSRLIVDDLLAGNRESYFAGLDLTLV
jgi:hypothetical protein